jgi:hypothetical protein
VRLYRILQLLVFNSCSFTRACRVPSSGQFWRPSYYAICCYTVLSFDLEPARQLPSNSCHCALVPHPSTSCLRLLSICQQVPSSGRCWRPRYYTIYCDTVFAFGYDQRGNCLPIVPTVRSYPILQRLVFGSCPFTRTCRRRVDLGEQSILPSCCYTVLLFDLGPARQLHPSLS